MKAVLLRHDDIEPTFIDIPTRLISVDSHEFYTDFSITHIFSLESAAAHPFSFTDPLGIVTNYTLFSLQSTQNLPLNSTARKFCNSSTWKGDLLILKHDPDHLGIVIDISNTKEMHSVALALSHMNWPM